LAFGVAIGSVIFAGGGFYAVTTSQMSSFEKALNEHTAIFARVGDEIKHESEARAKLRDEYMSAMSKQTEIFSSINTEVKILGAKNETLKSTIDKLADQLGRQGHRN
jgi:hypothetical protein